MSLQKHVTVGPIRLATPGCRLANYNDEEFTERYTAVRSLRGSGDGDGVDFVKIAEAITSVIAMYVMPSSARRLAEHIQSTTADATEVAAALTAATPGSEEEERLEERLTELSVQQINVEDLSELMATLIDMAQDNEAAAEAEVAIPPTSPDGYGAPR